MKPDEVDDCMMEHIEVVNRYVCVSRRMQKSSSSHIHSSFSATPDAACQHSTEMTSMSRSRITLTTLCDTALYCQLTCLSGFGKHSLLILYPVIHIQNGPILMQKRDVVWVELLMQSIKILSSSKEVM